MRSASVFTAITLLGACAAPAPPQADPGAIGSDSDGTFTLEVRLADATVAEGEEILVEAALGHDAPNEIVLAGSGSGVIFFSVTRLEDGLTSGPPGMTADCAEHVIEAGRPIVAAFSKSGGFSDEDANAAFLRTYFADPELRLPAGTWRIEAETSAAIGAECGGPSLTLRASVDVAVGR